MQRHRRAATSLLAAVVLGWAWPAMAQAPAQAPPAEKKATTKPEGKLSSKDRKFVAEAAEGNMAEVELGKLAVERAGSDAVKQFGQRMVDDHGKANEELMQVAQQKGATPPRQPGTKHQQLRDRLGKLSGAEFDRAYMSEMVKDHKKDVAAFRQEASRGDDLDVKAWAAKTLPTLEDHAKLAQQVQGQVKSARKTKS